MEPESGPDQAESASHDQLRPAYGRADLVRRGYDAVSERYRGDGDDPAEYREWVGSLVALLPEGAEVLDLGCGCGVPVARDLTARGLRVLGVDISAVQVERARRLVPRARFRRADAAGLDLPAGSLDAVVGLYVLIHLPRAEQEALIGRIGTWLRPGGVLLATVGAADFTGEDPDWLGAPMWWDHPDAGTYRRWFAAAGLTIVRDEFVPEGDGGHQLLTAVADQGAGR